MVSLLRRLALPIAVTSLVVNLIITLVSLILWLLAFTHHWLDSVTFVSNVSMLALVFAGISGVAAAVAGLLALIPTDDLLPTSPEPSSPNSSPGPSPGPSPETHLSGK